MNTGWMKKISLALMLTLSLGMVACGSGQNSGDEENDQNVIEAQNSASRKDGGSVEFFDDGGSITRTDDGFVSVNTGDGGTFACDNGDCSLF
ncbi:MAG: hypothetical protein K8R69_02645 [Deltaproteobacteria bacterium]|nr:hypothetical protein [Deltaproteobacteria bacterium]